MKKILTVIMVFSLLFGNSYAYNPTQKDKDVVEKLTKSIENVIEKKGEKTREIFVKKLYELKEKTKNNEKLDYIVGELIENINNSTKAIEDIIKDLENIKDDETKKFNVNTNLLLISEYNDIYYGYIDNKFYGQDVVRGGCGLFLDDWNNKYIKAIKNIYDISYDLENKFLLDIIEYDYGVISKHFNNVCKINFFEKLEVKKDLKLTSFDDSYYFKFYIFYNSWYNKLNDYLEEESGVNESCYHIKDDWERFTYDKIEFLKEYTTKTGGNGEIYKKYFTKQQEKYRDLMKLRCPGINLK